MTDRNIYEAKELIDFKDYLEGSDRIITVSIDRGHINALLIHTTPEYRTGDGRFAMIKSEKPKDYTYLRFDLSGKLLLKARMRDEYFNFHHACFLPTDEVLLISGRCRFKDENGEADKNARAYGLDGKLLRDFTIGDGIQDVKIDSKGGIWVSYFDEGVFGNFGWDQPLGAPGLICWGKNGEKVWEFEPVAGLDYIADCYALNIDQQDNIWFYYYTDFPIVRLDKEKKVKFWEGARHGSHSINMTGNRLLMSAGYGEESFELLEMTGDKVKAFEKDKFQTKGGKALTDFYETSDGPYLGFLDGGLFYLADMNEIQ